MDSLIITEAEQASVRASFVRMIKLVMADGGDVGALRASVAAKNTVMSLVMFTFLWDEALAQATRDMGSAVARITPELKQSMEEVRAKAELDKWPFSIARASSIGELLRLTLSIDNELVPMTMEIKDLYSQQRFREQFTVATGKVLDRIKAKAFDTFISGLKIEQMKDTGTSVKEMVGDVFMRLLANVLEAENDEEASECLRSKGYYQREGALYFKLSKLKGEYELRSIKPERLAQSLDDLGAEKVSRGVWVYKKAV